MHYRPQALGPYLQLLQLLLVGLHARRMNSTGGRYILCCPQISLHNHQLSSQQSTTLLQHAYMAELPSCLAELNKTFHGASWTKAHLRNDCKQGAA